MTVERHDENRLPNEVLNERAFELFEKAKDILRYNKGFAESVVDVTLDDPQFHDFSHKPGKVTFESRGYEYIANLNKDIWRDEITIQTTNEGVEESIRILLMYAHKTINYHSVRGDVTEAGLVYAKHYRLGENLSPVYVNNAKASEEVSNFLRRI
jgi:hypothetical protein